MKWNADSFEKEIRLCNFFKDYGYTFVRREVEKPGTYLECHIVRLENSNIDRSIEITFFPSKSPDELAISYVNIIKLSIEDGFDLKDYIKQHHHIAIDVDKFRYKNFPGTYEEKVRGFLKLVTGLLEKYAIPILKGKEWPDVDFDWQGCR